MTPPSVDVVVPTVGRPSLDTLRRALDAQRLPGRVIVVDDATDRAGPAHARNRGWRRSSAEWVAFLDDDVIPDPDWADRLLDDLANAPADVAGVQGRVRVPLPSDRRPTDWERNVAGLEHSRWITADMAFRRAALAEVGGFDERFPRAYREDADLALRLVARGYRLTAGSRAVAHPVASAPWTVSITKQRGNADDALMRRLHGHDWRRRADAPAGTLARHAMTTALATVAATSLTTRRRALGAVAAAGWLAATADFARRRIAPGPRTAGEVVTMAVTSAAIPPVAVWHRLRGELRARRVARLAGPRPAAVLFDRDGTLVVDVAYNGDPSLVQPAAGAPGAVHRLRAAGIRVGIVSNQSGVARGILTGAQVDAVNDRVAELLGPFDAVQVCPHGPDDGCECRKPRPGLVVKAAADLGVAVEDCIVVGDIGSDVDAAVAAGARAILVPTPVTRRREVLAARFRHGGRVAVARDLIGAVELVLGARR